MYAISLDAKREVGYIMLETNKYVDVGAGSS